MAIALRATTAALATGTTSVTPSAPSGFTNYDVLLAFIIDELNTIATTTPPTGWTLLGSGALSGGRVQAFYAIHGQNGLTGTSWTWSGLTTAASGQIVGFSGCDNGAPIDCTSSFRGNASGTTGTPQITTLTNNAMVVAAFCSVNNGATWSSEAVATSPTITEQLDNANGATHSIAIAIGAKATAGATGASSATMSANANNVGVLIALREETVGVCVSKIDTCFLLASASVAPPVWPTFTFANGVVAVAYDQRFTPTGAGTITVTLLSGSLPTGLSLSNVSGNQYKIAGTPTTVGSYSFTLRASNAYGVADQAFTIDVVAPGGYSFCFVS